MFGLRRNDGIEKKYRELETEEEALEFQKKYYGAYCEDYIRRMEALRNADHKCRYVCEYEPLEAYLGNMHINLNSYMRGEETDSEHLEYTYNMLIDKIKEEITSSPRIPEDMVVYRAVSNNVMKNVIKKSVKRNGEFLEKAFMSTSLLFATVKDLYPSGHSFLKIYVHKNARGLGVDCIKNRGEHEILFSAMQRLKYLGKNRFQKVTIYEFEMLACAPDC